MDHILINLVVIYIFYVSNELNVLMALELQRKTEYFLLIKTVLI